MSAQPAHLLSPLSDDKLALLARLTEGLDQDSLHWVSGYIAGVAGSLRRPIAASVTLGLNTAIAPANPEGIVQQRLTIVYGSQTGNAKRQAEALAREVEASGFAVRLVRADAYATRDLAAERLLYIVISTQGDGDPPDDARGFVEFIAGKRAPKLPLLRFAVLGLGDSSYPQFCAIGAKLDTRLVELGATRLFARGDADLDIATVADPWSQQALDQAREILKDAGKSESPTTAPLATVTNLRAPAAAASPWTRERPFAAALLANQRISARNGSKDIRHIELSLEGSGLSYEPGDALGVWATNPPSLVDDILTTLKLDGARAVSMQNETATLREWLLSKREITKLSKPVLIAHAQRAQHAKLDQALSRDGGDALRDLLGNYQLIDVLREFPGRWQAEDLIASLRPLTPRLYSIASSRKRVGDEVHLTVALLDYQAFGNAHLGSASHHLATLDGDATVPVFIEANERFRLPADPSRDVIMIGPGTGVAPFRSFLQERAETAAKGRNWLFFGNPHFRTDFLYQVEWQQALKNGSLQRLDLAFSRDQSEKVYVQHALRRRGRELYDWISQGAHIYVCGDAKHMAADVDAALRDIVIEHGGKSEDEARDLLNQLTLERRYARDVY